MKNAILFFLFVFGFALTAQAQSCGSKKAEDGSAAVSSCCSKSKAAGSASVEASKGMGGMDIEQRTNAAGEVSYVRKMVNQETGDISFKAVEYCTKTNQFVDADATTPVEAKANCSDAEKAGCCSKTKGAAAKGKSKSKA
jgi:hypothetical protein